MQVKASHSREPSRASRLSVAPPRGSVPTATPTPHPLPPASCTCHSALLAWGPARVQVHAPHGLRDAWVSPGCIIFSGQRPQPAEREEKGHPLQFQRPDTYLPSCQGANSWLCRCLRSGVGGGGGTGDASHVL